MAKNSEKRKKLFGSILGIIGIIIVAGTHIPILNTIIQTGLDVILGLSHAIINLVAVILWTISFLMMRK